MAEPLGANCSLITDSDSRRVRCDALSYGIDVVSSEDVGRLSRTFNPHHTDSHSFSLRIVCSTHEEFTELNTWLHDFVKSTIQGKGTVMRVQVPSRDFDRVGVLQGGIEFGTHVGEVTFPITLTFIGARDAVTTTTAILSQFVPSGTDYKEYGQYFYPAGTQLSGDERPSSYGEDIPTGFLAGVATQIADILAPPTLLGPDGSNQQTTPH